MNGHVVDEIVDLLAGMLSPARQREIEDHVEHCSECAEQLDWARKFRDEALSSDLAHLPAMRIVQIAAEPDTVISSAERQHLRGCTDCRDELEWTRALPDDGDAVSPVEPTTLVRPSIAARWLFPMGLAAAVAAVVVLMILPSGRSEDPAGLARIDALPVEMTRDSTSPDAFGQHRLRGLELYSEGDYSAARTSFLEAESLRSDETVSLYLASSELLSGMSEDAIDRLRRLSQSAGDATVREEALWQLANAVLSVGSLDDSERALRRLVELDGYHAAEALALLDALTAARK